MAHSGNPTTRGLYQVQGHAVCDGQLRPWTLVLKILHAAEGYTAPTRLGYWRREALIYDSGLLDFLPSGVSAPRCLGIDTLAEDTLWLWLEAITSSADRPWPLARYGLAARHLGRFNGAYVGHPLGPASSWLQHDFLRGWAALGEEGLRQLPTVLRHRRVERLLPPARASRLVQLWEERYALVQYLARLPQTLCHLDALRRNMIARADPQGDDQTVLLDWGEAGRGALGEDLAAFVTGSVFLDADTPPAHQFETVALAAYLEGLDESGWSGDRAAIVQGYRCAAALRLLGGMTWVLRVALSATDDSAREQALGQPNGEVLDRWAEAIRVVVGGLD